MRTKKLQIIAIVLLFSVNLFSQQYKPLLIEGNSWHYLELQGLMCFCAPLELTNCYTSQGDTVVNGLHYNKLYNAVIEGDRTQPAIYVGCIREDINNQKVYFIDSYTNTEQLIYSFNVNVGDKIVVSQNGRSIEKVVTAIGTYDFNGVSGKKITINTEEYWFEGIGSSLELIPKNYHLKGDGLLCFSNKSLIYDSNLRPNCQGISTSLVNVDDLDGGSAINIFPNPTNGPLTIKTTSDVETIEIYDIAGKLVFKTSALELDLSGFDNGIYFVTISLKSGERLQKKIVKAI